MVETLPFTIVDSIQFEKHKHLQNGLANSESEYVVDINKNTNITVGVLYLKTLIKHA